MFATVIRQNTELKRTFLSKFNTNISKFKGDISEISVATALKLFLSKKDIVINNVVLEPVRYETIQLDHLVLSERGIFIIEDKNWHGIYYCNNEDWYLHKNRQWIPVKSPVAQQKRHVRLFAEWLKQNGFQKEVSYITPIIVIKNALLLNRQSVSMPMHSSAVSAVLSIYSNRKRISKETIRRIAEKINAQ